VLPFVTYAHRKFTNSQLSEMSEAFSGGGKLIDLLPVYKKMGSLLVSKHKVEQNAAKASNISGTEYPTLPPFITSEPGRNLKTLSPEFAAALVRFISVSSHPNGFSNYEDHERNYNELIKSDPEKYSPFRESNPTYQRMLAVLQPEDPRYLAQLMMWRVYGWGLAVEIREQLGLDRIESGAEFCHNWQKAKNCFGKESMTVTAYGGRYPLNVPSDLDGMERIWKGGERLWTKWSDHIPVNFVDAQISIGSEGLPMFTNGKLSRLLLLGDLVRALFVVPPTEVEMAKLVVDANAGAYKGLKILGCERDVALAFHEIRKLLNDRLPESVKTKFHGGEVGLFDIEHILCKVHRKQGKAKTSTIWRTGMDLTKRGSKRRIETQQTTTNPYGLRKRVKIT
jgi:hypothetical protein